MSLSDEYKLLSDNFREKMQSYGQFKRLGIERLMLQCFSANTARNVALYTTNAGQKRNFISFQTDPKERDIRIKFVRALLNEVPPNRPTKEQTFNPAASNEGLRLNDYLTDPYVGGEVEKAGALQQIITGVDGALTIVYDAYPSEGFGAAQEVTPNDPDFDGILIE